MNTTGTKWTRAAQSFSPSQNSKRLCHLTIWSSINVDDYTRDPDIRPMLDKQTGKLVGYLDFDSLNVLELEDDEPYYLRCTVCGAIGDVTLNSFREFPPAHSKCLDASEVPIFD